MDWLSSKEIGVVVITNGHATVQREKLAAAEIEPLIPLILVGGEEIQQGRPEKPASSIFWRACSLIGCQPEEVSYTQMTWPCQACQAGSGFPGDCSRCTPAGFQTRDQDVKSKCFSCQSCSLCPCHATMNALQLWFSRVMSSRAWSHPIQSLTEPNVFIWRRPWPLSAGPMSPTYAIWHMHTPPPPPLPFPSSPGPQLAQGYDVDPDQKRSVHSSQLALPSL